MSRDVVLVKPEIRAYRKRTNQRAGKTIGRIGLFGLLFILFMIGPSRLSATEATPFRFTVEPEQPTVNAKFDLMLRPAQLSATEQVTSLTVTLKHGTRTMFSTEAFSPAGGQLTVTPVLAGQYEAVAISRYGDGSSASQSFTFQVNPKPVSLQKVGLDTLMLLVTSGVIVALTIGFFIVLRLKPRQRPD